MQVFTRFFWFFLQYLLLHSNFKDQYNQSSIYHQYQQGILFCKSNWIEILEYQSAKYDIQQQVDKEQQKKDAEFCTIFLIQSAVPLRDIITHHCPF
jgi:hypothetical protein